MLPRILHRAVHHTSVLWAAFSLVAVGTGYAVFRLYDTIRTELHEQSERAVAQQRDRAIEQIRIAAETERLRLIKALVSLHSEGLSHALRRWDERTPEIVTTFEWDEARGLTGTVDPTFAKTLPAHWKRFREWQGQQPRAVEYRPQDKADPGAIRTLDQPLLPSTELGYQAENIENLTYNGGRADPWAGWAITDAPYSTIALWYQLGPDSSVRGGTWDVTLLAEKLAASFTDSPLVCIRLIREPANPSAPQSSLAPWLPGYVLNVSPGELFETKQSTARLTALAAGGLCGVCLLGVVILISISRRELREAEQKATFVTHVSHELRTPMTSVRLYAEMLEAPNLAPEKRLKFAGMIRRESERLGTLIERLLTFAALEKGTHRTGVAAIEVGEFLRAVAEEMDPAFRAAGMRVVLNLPDSALRVQTDPAALKQALLNLLDNAAKYARSGGVVTASAHGGGTGATIRVRDEGPGVPPSLRESIFEPFVQGQDSLTDKPAGVGLGLSIARGLLRASGGDVVLLPSPSGAVFEIRLPATPAS